MEGGAANAGGSFEEFITRFLRPASLSAEECPEVGSVRRPRGCKDPELLLSLLNPESEVDPSTSLAAAIALKNLVRSSWG